MQNATHLLMIEPVCFGFNEQTAVNNLFQKNTITDAQYNALQEFNAFVSLLRQNGIDITVVQDSLQPATPDSIFPNNWISFHADGTVFLYPMFAENRRLERKPAVLEMIGQKFCINKIIDLAGYETDGVFLEGTGSMVLDREHKIAYACLSPRTNEMVLQDFCSKAGYKGVTFFAADKDGAPIYHTNVMMCIADGYAVVCTDAVIDDAGKKNLLYSLERSGKELIEITQEQLYHFAGNMLQVKNTAGELLLLMSTQAYLSLTQAQLSTLEKYNRILHSPLDHIETAGGGSARCMLAELFLPAK